MPLATVATNLKIRIVYQYYILYLHISKDKNFVAKSSPSNIFIERVIYALSKNFTEDLKEEDVEEKDNKNNNKKKMRKSTKKK
jgi:hypothetical protein